MGGSTPASTCPLLTEVPSAMRFDATMRPSNGTVTSASPPVRGRTSPGTRKLERSRRSLTTSVAKSNDHCCSFRNAIVSSFLTSLGCPDAAAASG